MNSFREMSPSAAYDAIVRCEGTLMKELRWDLLLLTPLHIVQAMLGMGVVFSDDLPTQPSSRMLKSVRKYAEFFCDFAVQQHEMLRYRPSIIALACVLCSRESNCIAPVWNA